MSFFPRLLNFGNFQNPLLRTIVPSVTAALAVQAAVAIPSVAFQTERFYDVSGSLTYLAVGALSLYLPALRAKAVTGEAKLPSILGVFTGGAAGGVWNWRQVVLTGAVTLWAARLGSYLFQRVLKEGKDSRFDEIKKSPPKFFVAFFAQAMWVSLCIMPVLAINATPSIALSSTALGSSVLLTDVLGLGLWAGGFLTEVIADRQKSQWMKEKREKQHDEEFLTRGLFGKSRFPNYFGEMTLWTGIATTAAGVLARKPAQLALGLSGGAAGILTTTALSFISPAFASFLLLKVSGVPMSEKKYDKRYGDRKDYQEWKKNTPKLIPKIW